MILTLISNFLEFQKDKKNLGHPGVPRDPPENEQNPYIHGGLLAPLGGPKYLFFSYGNYLV